MVSRSNKSKMNSSRMIGFWLLLLVQVFVQKGTLFVAAASNSNAKQVVPGGRTSNDVLPPVASKKKKSARHGPSKEVISAGKFLVHSFAGDFMQKDAAMRKFQKPPIVRTVDPNYPSWKDILELPITDIKTRKQWRAIPYIKRLTIMARTSVLHLTVLSSLTPLLFRGAVRASLALGGDSFTDAQYVEPMDVSPSNAMIWTLCMVSWHALHNMMNDWQDLQTDDAEPDSFRLAYGVHALKQKFISQPSFMLAMLLVGLPGMVLSVTCADTILGPFFPFGFGAVVFYTPIFKPLALGELLVYLVWGPIMAGAGSIAAGCTHLSTQNWKGIITDPIVSLLGSIAFSVIWGKHTDKIGRSKANTFPSLLGYGGGALTVAASSVLLPHILLARALLIGRVGRGHEQVMPIVPLGAALGFLALYREGLWSLAAIVWGEPKNGPTIRLEILRGTLGDINPVDRWPLWFVGFLGWHAVTFGYLLFMGSGLEWLIRSILNRIFV